MDRPKISGKSLEDMKTLLHSGKDPLSKKLRNIEREAQKNVMKMFSKDGGKKDEN